MYFTIYHIIWIICLVLLFLSIFVMLRRRRRNYNGGVTQAENYIIVDMNGLPTGQQQPTYPASYAPPPPPPQTNQSSSNNQQTFYRPPDTSDPNPPPPSYQDYNKDYRVNHIP